MDRRVAKLQRLGVPQATAEALVAAGLDTPRKIKAARVKDITSTGAKSADVDCIRKRDKVVS